jgi:hypothetical protein
MLLIKVNTATILCYATATWAFFTTRSLKEQWGDDWNDAPYEHNAGDPYEPCWHNGPSRFVQSFRGCRPGTTTPLGVGELCRCAACLRDWNDDGTPKFEIVKVAWAGDFMLPHEGHLNSPWSVEQINSLAVAWLRTPEYTKPELHIFAGTTLDDFIKKIKCGGGSVYLPV